MDFTNKKLWLTNPFDSIVVALVVVVGAVAIRHRTLKYLCSFCDANWYIENPNKIKYYLALFIHTFEHSVK